MGGCQRRCVFTSFVTGNFRRSSSAISEVFSHGFPLPRRLFRHCCPPLFHNRHVCPSCCPSVRRTIFACSFSTLFAHFNACTCPRVFATHRCCASNACSFLGVCAALWRGHQCVLTPCIPALLTSLTRCVPGLFSFQLTVSCLGKLRRSWHMRRKPRFQVSRSFSKSSRPPASGRYTSLFFVCIEVADLWLSVRSRTPLEMTKSPSTANLAMSSMSIARTRRGCC